MKLVALQYLRAVAAICVVLYHAGFYLNVYRSDPTYANVMGQDFGTFGVFAFFALSGFLMAVQLNKPQLTASRFLLHRLLRIYPIFWIICIVKIGVFTSVGYGVQFDPLALSLAPVGARNYVLGVEWTLIYEVFFYFVVSVVILLRIRQHIIALAALWLVAICINCWVNPGYSPQFIQGLLGIPLSSTCAAFAAGMLMPAFLRRGMIGHAALPIGLFCFAVSQVSAFRAFGNVGVGIGCAFIVAWCATIIDTEETHSTLLAKMGDWSFSIYLVHVPICTAILLAVSRFVSPLVVWWLIIAAVLLIGGAFGVFDIWLYRRLRSWGDRLPRRIQAAVSLAFLLPFAGAMSMSGATRYDLYAIRPELALLQGATDPDDAVAILQNAGYTPDPKIRDSLDMLVESAGGVAVGGWMNDPGDIWNRTSMLIVGDNAPPVVAFPRDYRFDVIAAFGISGFLAPFAFNYTIDGASCGRWPKRIAVTLSLNSKVFGPPKSVTCTSKRVP